MLKKIDWDRQIGRRLRLRDLHVFFTVAQSGSMAKAAAQLGVSTPTVSEVIADLEHGLGVRLFGVARFRGRLSAWDPGIWSDGILPSCLASFFCLAPGGAILSSRPVRRCGRRAQRRSRTAPLGGRPEGLSLTAASTAACWRASGWAA